MPYKQWLLVQLGDEVPAVTPGTWMRVTSKTTTRGRVDVQGVDIVTGDAASAGGNSDSTVEVR